MLAAVEISMSSAAAGMAAGLAVGVAAVFLWGGAAERQQPVAAVEQASGSSPAAPEAGAGEWLGSAGSSEAPSENKPATPAEGSRVRLIEEVRLMTRSGKMNFEATRALYERVAGASKAELLAALDELGRNPGQETFVPMSILASRLGELDPKLAVQQALAQGSRQRSWMVNSVYGAWARVDAAAALASLDQVDDRQLRDGARQSILSAMAWMDPERALSLALAGDGGPSGSSLHTVSLIFSRMAEADPAAAAGRALSLPTGRARDQAIGGVFGRWFNQDRQAALKWVEALPSAREREHALGAVSWTWAREDPEGLAAYIAQQPGSRSRFASVVASAWTRQDPERAVAWAQSLRGDVRRNALSSCYSAWAQEDPAAAARSALLLENTEQRRQAVSNVLATWANREPDAAIAWLDSLKDDESAAMRGYSSIGHQLASQDPAKAIALLGRVEGESERRGLIHSIARQYAERDPDAALRWALSLASDQERENAIRPLFETLARDNVREGLAEIGRLPAGPMRRQAEDALASVWAQQDPAGAADWLVKLSDPESRSGAMQQVASRWLDEDEYAASQWINGLPAGKLKDMAIQPILQRTRESEPDLAWGWAEAISEEGQRRGQLRQIARSWLEADPAAARAAIRKTPLLTDPEKTSLLEGK